MPNTMWAAELLNRTTFGFDAFEPAMPNPIAGCMMSNGAATVVTPTISAGRRVGAVSQFAPATAMRRQANRSRRHNAPSNR